MGQTRFLRPAADRVDYRVRYSEREPWERPAALAQRLGKNVNGYFGERIELQAVMADLRRAAAQSGWSAEVFLPAPELVALHRAAARTGGPAVYISTGIHGDEPAGPLAARELIRANAWRSDLNLWMVPCLNPTGLARGTRECASGLDLNRQYRKPAAPEIVAHIRWLERQPRFDLALCLHEDWESQGFYLYELNPDNLPSLAPEMLARVERVCPLDPSEVIEGMAAQSGLIRPLSDPRSRPDWPEAFYLLTHKTRRSYTLEAPSDFPLSVRVAALVAGVRAALDQL